MHTMHTHTHNNWGAGRVPGLSAGPWTINSNSHIRSFIDPLPQTRGLGERSVEQKALTLTFLTFQCPPAMETTVLEQSLGLQAS